MRMFSAAGKEDGRPSLQYRRTYIQVDLNAIAENAEALRRSIAPTRHMMAVVKANDKSNP